MLQLRPRSDFGRLVLARSKPLGGQEALAAAAASLAAADLSLL